MIIRRTLMVSALALTLRSAAAESAPRLTDAEIIASVVAVDDNEINLAKAAQTKQLSSKVRSYANMLSSKHSKNKATMVELSRTLRVTPQATPESQKLRKNGSRTLNSLAQLDGKEFEQAYVDAMVDGHEDLLELIDGSLIKAATTSALQAQLRSTRDHIAAHLEEGKRLKSLRIRRSDLLSYGE